MKLTVEIPLGVHRVVERPGGEDLIPHCHFAVRVAFTWARRVSKTGEENRLGATSGQTVGTDTRRGNELETKQRDEKRGNKNPRQTVKCDQTGGAGNI